jgi:hypothetical protein
LDTGPRGGQQHNDRQLPGRQLLLVAHILVRRDEEVVACVFRNIQ